MDRSISYALKCVGDTACMKDDTVVPHKRHRRTAIVVNTRTCGLLLNVTAPAHNHWKRHCNARLHISRGFNYLIERERRQYIPGSFSSQRAWIQGKWLIMNDITHEIPSSIR